MSNEAENSQVESMERVSGVPLTKQQRAMYDLLRTITSDMSVPDGSVYKNLFFTPSELRGLGDQWLMAIILELTTTTETVESFTRAYPYIFPDESTEK